MKNKTYIIAEGACAHEGNFDAAKEMIRIAKIAQVDAIKFQIFNPNNIPNITSIEREYLEKVQFTKEDFKQLMLIAEGIDFFLTPFDIASIDACKELGLDTIKIPSGRVTDIPYMTHIFSKGFKRIFVSSGMLNQQDLIWLKAKFPGMIWLHCVTAYPAPEEEMNLNVLKGKTFDGLSDHTLSTDVPSIAVACGAKYIEKHFTLNRNQPGPDQKCSLEPLELMDMVHKVRRTEIILGNSIKKVMPSEAKMAYRMVDKRKGKLWKKPKQAKKEKH